MKYTLKTYRIILPNIWMDLSALADLPAKQTEEEFEAGMKERGFTKQD